jgi:multidrug efflux pump subunit AcrB
VAILQGALVSENASWADLRREAERLEEELEKLDGIEGADVLATPGREIRVALNLPGWRRKICRFRGCWVPYKAKT